MPLCEGDSAAAMLPPRDGGSAWRTGSFLSQALKYCRRVRHRYSLSATPPSWICSRIIQVQCLMLQFCCFTESHGRNLWCKYVDVHAVNLITQQSREFLYSIYFDSVVWICWAELFFSAKSEGYGACLLDYYAASLWTIWDDVWSWSERHNKKLNISSCKNTIQATYWLQSRLLHSFSFTSSSTYNSKYNSSSRLCLQGFGNQSLFVMTSITGALQFGAKLD